MYVEACMEMSRDAGSNPAASTPSDFTIRLIEHRARQRKLAGLVRLTAAGMGSAQHLLHTRHQQVICQLSLGQYGNWGGLFLTRLLVLARGPDSWRSLNT